MVIRHIALVLAAAAVVSTGCDRSVRLAGPSETGQDVITEVLTGTVVPPVDNVLQRTFRTFTVGQGGGPVTITLTAAVLTRPDGTQLATVQMGLGAGTVVNGACEVPVSQYVVTQASATPQLAGNLPAGTYCVQVSDVTSQVGPVVFSITVEHT
jgi:hypothetical protein